MTGASRGAGRGIALALGEHGATVYVTGRSTREQPTPDRPGTVDDTGFTDVDGEVMSPFWEKYLARARTPPGSSGRRFDDEV